NDLGTQSGSAYVFRREGQGWVETQKLLASDGETGNRFGTAVAIDGDVALIGAFGHLHDDESGSGSAYVFRYNGSTWMEEQELLASDGAVPDDFGGSVAISGDVAVIGARFDDDNGPNAGAAYIFRFDADTSQWVEEQKLLASDGTDGDFFGTAVAIFGEVALVGADGHDDAAESAGAAYVFRYDAQTSRWVEEQKLLASDGTELDRFGDSVSISGDLALIGARLDVSGSAYVFRFDPRGAPGSQWVQEQKLLASDPTGADQFGRAVAIDGDIAVIGSPFADAVGIDHGAAYVFRYDPTTARWSQQVMLVPDPGPWSAFFGRSVAIDGETAVCGAHGEDQQRGAAYIYNLAQNCNCPHDLDADGNVGVSDLLSLLASWGPCKGCPADFDGNGNVGVSDLLTLLAKLGAVSVVTSL
ncbi:MAG: FG-GAP repeat protein, partial [Planctomycetes bacterium]|nr:FG-GAP repeat protein [Planctomycetota bacterium]